MALSIKTEEADRLARELAAVTHESLTEAVTVALRERLERVRREEPDGRGRLASLRAYVATLPVEDDRSPEPGARSPQEIVGYDEHGLPA